VTTLSDRYPEMGEAGQDLALEHLMNDLDRVGTASRASTLPSQHEMRIARALQEQTAGPARGGRTRQRSHPLFRRNRPLAMVCVFLLAGAAYSAITVLDQAFNMNPGTQRIVTANLGRVLGLTRTVAGFTVTIGRVYADSNQIVIGYTISGPPNRTFNSLLPFAPPDPRIPSLTDAAGREFPVGPVSWGTGVQEGRVGGVLMYQTAGIADASKDLALHLTFAGILAVERIGENPSSSRDVVVHQAFDFTFPVPFDVGRVAELHDAATVGGTTVTLERVVVTKTETEVFLRGAGPDAEAHLSVDGSTYALDQQGATPTGSALDSLWSYGTTASLMDKQGQWALVVKPGLGPPRSPKLKGGPWAFHFTVPSAGP